MITIDVKAALIYLVLAALIVMVIYLIIIAKNLVKTIKHTNQILEDTTVISGIAADKAKEIDAIIGDVLSAVSDVSNAVKGQQNLIGAVSNIVKSFGSLAAIFNHDKNEGAENGNKKK